jgi:hypothetical protein
MDTKIQQYIFFHVVLLDKIILNSFKDTHTFSA